MKAVIIALAASACLAFGGCSTVPQLEQVAGSFISTSAQQIAANPSLIPCLASEAAVLLGPALGQKGSSIRGTNKKTVRVSRAACQKLGGTVQPETAANANAPVVAVAK